MTLPPPLAIAPEERIAPAATGTAGGARGTWAAIASLLFHGTALAAVLIAARGEGPQLPPPAIEVSVVIAGAPPPGAAIAAEAERAEQAASAPAENISEPKEMAEAPAEPAPPPLAEPAPPPVVEAAPVLAWVPPPPARKPDPPRPADRPRAHAEPAEITQAKPQSRPRQPDAHAAQLAALPDGDGFDSAAAPGADTAVPPRYLAGGEANPWPRYPPAARRRGIEGEVLLRVSVGVDGTAETVEVLRSSGHALLDREAQEALRRWRFEPARAAGQPVAATVEIPVTFRLTDPKQSEP